MQRARRDWLPYVPQLLLSLLNREAPHAKPLLLRVAQAHPQALYCPLRTVLLERRETAARVTQSARALAAKARERQARRSHCFDYKRHNRGTTIVS